MKRILLAVIVLAGVGFVCADGSTAAPPTVYQPNYVYGETPMGVYMGNPYDMGDDMMGDDMYLPNGEAMQEMQTQSGEQEQQFQYWQGQEQLMRSNSQEKVKQYYQNLQMDESMSKIYLQQIESQTHQTSQQQQPIVLPNM